MRPPPPPPPLLAPPLVGGGMGFGPCVPEAAIVIVPLLLLVFASFDELSARLTFTEPDAVGVSVISI
jgi:hypothetical protein